jgi:predicted transcriptional regulator of viral defense system
VLQNQPGGDIYVTKTVRELSAQEAEFLSRLSADGQTIFSTAQAREFWGNADYTVNVLSRLARKGWLQRLERGVYMIVPLEAGPQRDWSESALVIAPHLIQPAAVAYWSALHYWNMTEQVPHTVFVQSTRRKRPVEILGMRFHFVSVSQARFFGVTRRTLDGKPIYVTDREKTLLDAAARPDLSGGVEQLAQALHATWADLDWTRLDDYLTRWGGGVVAKRLGYLVEALSLPVSDLDRRLERWRELLSQGISLLEPAAQTKGPVVTRWRIRVNVAVPTLGRKQI